MDYTVACNLTETRHISDALTANFQDLQMSMFRLLKRQVLFPQQNIIVHSYALPTSLRWSPRRYLKLSTWDYSWKDRSFHEESLTSKIKESVFIGSVG